VTQPLFDPPCPDSPIEAMKHGMHMDSKPGRRYYLHQSSCQCGWTMADWFLSEDLAAELWEDHIAEHGLTVDAILTAKGRS
jgi:hypothetical protein